MIHIVSGEAMLSQIDLYHILNGTYIPFNEAMCDGFPKKEIFSNEFINERCQTHNISFDDYQMITINPLQNLNPQENYHLWFGNDMFCQINALTLLAYFETMHIDHVTMHIIDEKKQKVIDVFELSTSGYMQFYENILVNKKNVVTPNSYLNNSLPYYFNYRRKDKKIIQALMNDFPTIEKLIQNDSIYGLGDLQWKKWIQNL